MIKVFLVTSNSANYDHWIRVDSLVIENGPESYDGFHRTEEREINQTIHPDDLFFIGYL